jgi:regulation of enolase protein 1 (concanavalin A-like superfamily)
MRIFHLHTLGETTAEMGKLDPFVGTERPIRFGVYACSPLDSSFAAEFDHFSIDRCQWPAHGTEGS